MRRLFTVAVVLLVATAGGTVAVPVSVDLAPPSDAVSVDGGQPVAQADPPERVAVIVGFEGAPQPAAVRRHGGDISRVYSLIPAVAATLPEPAIEALERTPAVAYVERDEPVEIRGQTTPWGIDRVDAPNVHATDDNSGGADVDVAVIDTGMDYTHPDLDERYAGGYDFWNNDDDPMDDNGHGTHVSGTVAAEDNEFGVVGVAPEVDVYAVKSFNDSGVGFDSTIVAGIEWAVEGPDGVRGTDDDAEIISMSFGSDGASTAERDALEAARRNGTLLVAAAGNAASLVEYRSGCDVEYPAAYDTVIAVSATDRNDDIASFSCTGPKVELAAPGVEINSTQLGGGYTTSSGTSMATPHVSGLAGLVYHSIVAEGYDGDSDGYWSNFEVRERLRDTAVDLGDPGHDELYGFGLIDAPPAVGVQARPTAGTGELDRDDDLAWTTHAHPTEDPADGARTGVVHLTSHDRATTDYALTTVDVGDRGLTISEVSELRVDYYEGPNNTHAAPDELWLVLGTDAGRHVVFRTYDEDAPNETWHTLDATGDLTDSDRDWREVDRDGPSHDPWAELATLGPGDLANAGANLSATYGPDARLLAVGVGHGSPTAGPTTPDLFIDDLRLDGRTDEFPAVVVEVTPDPLNTSASGDYVNATIDLTGDWAGLTVHDINTNTLRLNDVPATYGSAGTGDVDGDGDDELRVSFNRTAVEETLAAGDAVDVTVTGIFEDGRHGLSGSDRITVT